MQTREASGVDVTFEAVTKAYGNIKAVDDVTLRIEAGEFVSLLGPSGSGKTTLLMILAGFERPGSGRVLLGSNDITDVPVNKRDIGMVFQRYTLFPHMTVAENIAFPLRMRGMAKAIRDEEIRKVLDIVKLGEMASRSPSQLSGGQQQRIALARAIVFRPKLILMDEPLGALDKKLRQHLQIEIKQLQERLGATVIFVTHDQEEALTMSDRIAVVDHGKILQFGTPEALYRSPKSSFVANFVGEMNFLAGSIVDFRPNGSLAIKIGETIVEAVASEELSHSEKGSTVSLAIRPEHLAMAPLPGDRPGLEARVVETVFSGTHKVVYAELAGGETVRFLFRADETLMGASVGDAVTLTWDTRHALAFRGNSA